MLDVFFTVDVEIWCDGWHDIDRKFPDAFRQYIYGPTSRGDYGLPFQLRVLDEHGLTGTFFVEPLFSARFGAQPLAEIVGLIQAGRGDVQLHLHTEWADEALEPLLPGSQGKRQHLRHFSLDEQTTLIGAGANMLKQAGGGDATAFRAGSFGFNRDTLRALARVRIPFDSSYNASLFGLDSGVLPGTTAVDSFECDGVHEYPMTVFTDGVRPLRHAQLTACSYAEMEGLLWQALEAGRRSFVILSHSFELLGESKSRPDDVVVGRFLKLCAFLDRHRDSFRVGHFREPALPDGTEQPAPLVSPLWRTGARMIEQFYRRRYA
jgi:peptidoglycan/xylan/chitin deacetylase (PgdA/CDA1 family)